MYTLSGLLIKGNVTVNIDGNITVGPLNVIDEIINTQNDLAAHTADTTTNPHSITIEQVKVTGNKGDIMIDNGINIVALNVGLDGQLLQADSTTNTGIKWVDNIIVNNVGNGGAGLFKQKNGNILEFKNINAGSENIVVTDDIENHEVDIDIGSGVVTVDGTQTLTNKTISGSTNNVDANGLLTSSGSVNIGGAAAPTVGQVLVATSSTNAVWQDIASAYFYAYDAAGSITIASDWTDITFDTNPKINAIYGFTTGTAVVTINMTGDYIINTNVNLSTISGLIDSGAEIRIVVDTGTGFVEIPGTRATSSLAVGSLGTGMAIGEVYHSFNAGDKVKIQAMRSLGLLTIETSPNGCRLSIRTA